MEHSVGVGAPLGPSGHAPASHSEPVLRKTNNEAGRFDLDLLLEAAAHLDDEGQRIFVLTELIGWGFLGCGVDQLTLAAIAAQEGQRGCDRSPTGRFCDRLAQFAVYSHL